MAEDIVHFLMCLSAILDSSGEGIVYLVLYPNFLIG